MKMRLGTDTKHSAVQNFTLRVKTCSHNPTFSVVLINLRCYVLGFCWQTSKVCGKITTTNKHANNHANNAHTSWLCCLHHPAWMEASHGWVPVDTHSTPVPTTVGRPWGAQNHTSPILPTPPAWQAEPQIPVPRSPRSCHQQSGEQSSRATCCPFPSRGANAPEDRGDPARAVLPGKGRRHAHRRTTTGAEDYQSTQVKLIDKMQPSERDAVNPTMSLWTRQS